MEYHLNAVENHKFCNTIIVALLEIVLHLNCQSGKNNIWEAYILLYTGLIHCIKTLDDAN